MNFLKGKRRQAGALVALALLAVSVIIAEAMTSDSAVIVLAWGGGGGP